MSASVIVRPATVDDADAVARVHTDGWREGYRGLVPDTVLDELDLEASRRRWRSQLSNDRRRTREWVAVADGEVVGMVETVVPSTDPDARDTVAELMSLYVDAAHRRRGLASALVEVALQALTGCDEVTLWVLHNNQRALAFYRAHGWTGDGLARTDERGLRDVRLRRAL